MDQWGQARDRHFIRTERDERRNVVHLNDYYLRSLSHPLPEFRPQRLRFFLLEVHIVDFSAARVQVCFYWLHERLPQDDLMSNVQNREQDQTHVCNEEVAGVPRPVVRVSKGNILPES